MATEEDYQNSQGCWFDEWQKIRHFVTDVRTCFILQVFPREGCSKTHQMFCGPRLETNRINIV
jgi:hypothetical protein